MAATVDLPHWRVQFKMPRLRNCGGLWLAGRPVESELSASELYCVGGGVCGGGCCCGCSSSQVHHTSECTPVRVQCLEK